MALSQTYTFIIIVLILTFIVTAKEITLVAYSPKVKDEKIQQRLNSDTRGLTTLNHEHKVYTDIIKIPISPKDTSQNRLEKLKQILHDLDERTNSISSETKNHIFSGVYDFGYTSFKPLLDKLALHFLLFMFHAPV